jgi:hypothetical protein
MSGQDIIAPFSKRMHYDKTPAVTMLIDQVWIRHAILQDTLKMYILKHGSTIWLLVSAEECKTLLLGTITETFVKAD